MSPYLGLNSAEVAQRLKQFGYNELQQPTKKSFFKLIFEIVKEPMFLLLLSCGTLYMLIGDYKEGLILVSTIFIIIGVTYFQHRKTQNALNALKQLASPRALAFRNGVIIRIPGREVVPDDLLIINEGDRIAADGILIEGTSVHVDESVLTGESIPLLRTKDTTQNRLLAGCLVTQGTCKMQVTAIGIQTQFGKIGQSLSSIEEASTPLQTEMGKFIRNIGIIGFLLCILVVIAYYVTRGNLLQSILSGLSAAMAILPEEFPLVLTVFLTLGAWRLSKKNVLTRKSSAIETLGSATVLCSDKTGTITQNRMVVQSVYTDGKWEAIDPSNSQHNELVRMAQLAGSTTSADPMDRAVLELNGRSEYDKILGRCIEHSPFSHEFLALSSRYQLSDGLELIAIKGAPETILEHCSKLKPTIEALRAQLHQKAADGFRIIAVGSTCLPSSQNYPSIFQYDFDFVGLIALSDPIRDEVPLAVSECHSSGVRVIMITGDFPETAHAISQQIGLQTSAVLTGQEMDAMNDSDLREKLAHVNVLARIKPEQKLRIVESLKENGEIVAMTGDGVNDAPALKAAHIGIAMGQKGTDVAREASSIVLLDDNFNSIVTAIRMGRKLFDNLQKAMSYIIAVHIPIVGLALLPAFNSSLPLFLLPLHIVFMELIIDPVCSVVFESEDEELGIMNRPPRNPKHAFFGMRKVGISALHGLFLFLMVITVYAIAANEGHSDEECRTITFSALIMGNIVLIVTKLSKTRSFVSTLLNHNWRMKIAVGGVLLAIILIINIPSVAAFFSMKSPGWKHLTVSFFGTLTLLIVFETGKKFFRKI